MKKIDPAKKPQYQTNLQARHRQGKYWQRVFFVSTSIGIIALVVLLLNIINSAFGFAAVVNTIDPQDLAINNIPIEQLHQTDLVFILKNNLSDGLIRRLENELAWEERSREEIYALVVERVVEPNVVDTWSLYDSIFNKKEIQRTLQSDHPQATLEFKSWLSADFMVNPQSPDPELAGVRTAILGSLWTIAITIVFAFPMGVGAAIYLEEYATDTPLNRQTRW